MRQAPRTVSKFSIAKVNSMSAKLGTLDINCQSPQITIKSGTPSVPTLNINATPIYPYSNRHTERPHDWMSKAARAPPRSTSTLSTE